MVNGVPVQVPGLGNRGGVLKAHCRYVEYVERNWSLRVICNFGSRYPGYENMQKAS